jgi:sugar (pentulose or hexulose) kinase
MEKQSVIAIFDIGKTNKKLFLFNEDYKIVFERSDKFEETVDEDGDPCENLERLEHWVKDALDELLRLKQFKIKAVNFSTYGASFVYIDESGKAIAPLYNYLKAYPAALQKKFYDDYGGEEEFSFRTASPVLGNLNSGMQLYRIKYEKPELFARIKYALHLPQYFSFLFAGVACTDITSIGCHTNLWDFTRNDYHDWVRKENILEKFAPLQDCKKAIPSASLEVSIPVGVGLHDSSSALIPYLVNFLDPFILISTGTWCISLNPFNNTPLTKEELKNDCLCYMSYEGKPVKASRVFAGYEHEQEVDRIGKYFNLETGWYKKTQFNPSLINLKSDFIKDDGNGIMMKQSSFSKRDLTEFVSAAAAYHQLILDIARLQLQSTRLVLKGSPVKKLFVDGGFSNNAIYMNLLSAFLPGIEVYAASVAQASSLGAALAIHKSWNDKFLPCNLVQFKRFYAGNIPASTGITT